MRQIFVILDLY